MLTLNLPLIKLSGEPFDRGVIYGQSCRSLIALLVKDWKNNLGRFGVESTSKNKVNAEDYLQCFLSNTDYIKAIEQWAPDLLVEIRGIACGSEQEFDDLLAMQMMDEEWIFGLMQGLDKPVTKCTAFGIYDEKSGVSISGQNMDVPQWVDGKQVLLRIRPENGMPESMVFSMAGVIGLNGMNSSGLGVTCNTLPQLIHSTNGLPVAFIVRRLLEYDCIDIAEKFLRSINHASGQNYILSSKRDIRCFECCGQSVIRYYPNESPNRIFHTNHPMVNTDINSVIESMTGSKENTIARLNSIRGRLKDIRIEPSIENIKLALSAHDDPKNPVSRNKKSDASSIGYTVGSMIYQFTDTPVLHLAAGPPCETQFYKFGF